MLEWRDALRARGASIGMQIVSVEDVREKADDEEERFIRECIRAGYALLNERHNDTRARPRGRVCGAAETPRLARDTAAEPGDDV